MNAAAGAPLDGTMHKLLILDDAGSTRTEALDADEVTLGRREGNTVRLPEENVSRRHARIVRRDGRFVLVDLASFNGTVVNGERIDRERALEHGDRIRIGSFKLTFAQEGLPEPVYDREARRDEEEEDDDDDPELRASLPTGTDARTSPAAAEPATTESKPGEPKPADLNSVAESAPAAEAKPAESEKPAETAPGEVKPSAGESGAATEAKPAESASAGEPRPAPELPAFRMTATIDDLRRAARRGAVPFELRQARLIFLAPPEAPAPVGLEKLPLVLGSGEGADVKLPFASVAPQHARISLENGDLLLEALADASDAVVVNGAPTRKATLSVNDMLKLGEVEVRVGRRSYISAVRPNLAALAGTGEPPPEEDEAPRSRWALAAGIAGVVLTLGAAFLIVRGSPPPAPPPRAPAVLVSADAGAPEVLDASAPEAAVDAARPGELDPGETPQQRLERAQQASDDLDFATAVTLLSPLRERSDLEPALATNVALLETNALVALGREGDAAEACARALRTAPSPDALLASQSPPVQAVCRRNAGDAGARD